MSYRVEIEPPARRALAKLPHQAAIIYAVLEERMLVLVVELGHRRDIYRSW